MSMPTSAIAATAAGFTARPVPSRPNRRSAPPVREVFEPAERHLAASGVVDAQRRARTEVDARSRCGSRFTRGRSTSAVCKFGCQKCASATAMSAADDLRDDEHRNTRRTDPGERVGERARDRDGGIGEARRRCEPVGGRDVAADGEGGDLAAPRTDDAEDHEHAARRLRLPSASQRPPDERVSVESVTAGSANIRFASIAADATADDLRGDVDARRRASTCRRAADRRA